MAQFAVSKEIEFDAGHRVPDHGGQCKNLHGHRYKVVLAVRGYLQDGGSANGMVLDFSDIKKCLQEIHDKFDHGCIIYKEDDAMLCAKESLEAADFWFKWIVADFSPTAENLARWCFDFATQYFVDHNLPGTVIGVKVYETPTSCAFYPAT